MSAYGKTKRYVVWCSVAYRLVQRRCDKDMDDEALRTMAAKWDALQKKTAPRTLHAMKLVII